MFELTAFRGPAAPGAMPIGWRIRRGAVAAIVVAGLVAAPFGACPHHGSMSAADDGLHSVEGSESAAVDHSAADHGDGSPMQDHGPCDCVGCCHPEGTGVTGLLPHAGDAIPLPVPAAPAFAAQPVPPAPAVPYALPYPNPPPASG